MKGCVYQFLNREKRLFGIVLISVCTLMHVYVMWRAACTPPVMGMVSGKWIVLAGVALWIVFYLGRVYGHHGTGAAAGLLELVGMTWMGVLFLCSMTLFAADLVTGFGFLFPRFAPAARSAALFSGLALSAFALFQGMAAPVPERHEVELEGLPPELNDTLLVAVSDLHLDSRSNGKKLQSRMDAVAAENPDIVVFLGDIFEGHGFPEKNVLAVLSRIRAPLGKWAVLGNHESYGDQDAFVSMLRQAGFRVLRDQWDQPAPGLVLAGVDDLRDGRAGDRNLARIERALSRRPGGATVFLSHRPVYAETAAEKGANLMLSGHTHAGQIWPFSRLVSRRYPFFSGRYDVSGMTVIVSRGAGTWGPRMRLWRRGDILSVAMKSGKRHKERLSPD